MAQGNYDHPSYLTRQMTALGKSVAGANGTSCIKVFPCKVRLRNVASVILTAGTSATSGNQTLLYMSGTGTTYTAAGVGTQVTGTTSLGVIVNGTGVANTTGTSGDLNVTLNQGAIFFAKNGTDATGVVDLVGEIYLDPSATWTGSN